MKKERIEILLLPDEKTKLQKRAKSQGRSTKAHVEFVVREDIKHEK